MSRHFSKRTTSSCTLLALRCSTTLALSLASFSVSFVAETAFAQPAAIAPTKTAVAEPLSVTLARQKVVLKEGKEALEAADTAKPGEMLVETATYTNKSVAPLTKVEATLPIPPNTEFVAGSAQPAGALASVDGKTFAPMPLKKKSVGANGVTTEIVVPTSEYKSLRWSIGSLAAGKSAVVSAKVMVSK